MEVNLGVCWYPGACKCARSVGSTSLFRSRFLAVGLLLRLLLRLLFIWLSLCLLFVYIFLSGGKLWSLLVAGACECTVGFNIFVSIVFFCCWLGLLLLLFRLVWVCSLKLLWLFWSLPSNWDITMKERPSKSVYRQDFQPSTVLTKKLQSLAFLCRKKVRQHPSAWRWTSWKGRFCPVQMVLFSLLLISDQFLHPTLRKLAVAYCSPLYRCQLRQWSRGRGYRRRTAASPKESSQHEYDVAQVRAYIIEWHVAVVDTVLHPRDQLAHAKEAKDEAWKEENNPFRYCPSHFFSLIVHHPKPRVLPRPDRPPPSLDEDDVDYFREQHERRAEK